MHFGVAVALVIHLTNVDVRNRLAVGHHAMLVFMLIQVPAALILHRIWQGNQCRSFCHA